MSIMMTNKNQRGDTIVEVLIAVAIVSSVLTSAFMLSNRSSQIMQNASEQSQALKIAERQVELLRSRDIQPSDKCFNPSGQPTATDTDCEFDGSGQAAPAAYTGAIYKTAVTKIVATDTYKVTVTWDRLGGSTGSTALYYAKQI